jgi:hypothetical protein
VPITRDDKTGKLTKGGYHPIVKAHPSPPLAHKNVPLPASLGGPSPITPQTVAAHRTVTPRRAAAPMIPHVTVAHKPSAVKRYAPHFAGEPEAGREFHFIAPDGSVVQPGRRPPRGSRIGSVPYYTEEHTHKVHHGSTPNGFEMAVERGFDPIVQAPGVYRDSPAVRTAHEVARVGVEMTGLPATARAIETRNAAATAGNVAAFLPFFRGPRAIVAGIRAARSGEEALAAARASMHQPGPIANALKTRVFKVNSLEVHIPEAGSRTGAAAERVVDAARPGLAKVGLKGEEERAGQEYVISHRNKMKTLTNAATTLRKIGAHLSDAEQYALRIVGEGANPVERASFHAEQQANAVLPSEATMHGIHIAMIQKASKYIDHNIDGRPILNSKASKNLKLAHELMQEVAQQREDLYSELGALQDGQIADRVNAPGRVIRGARYLPTEREIEEKLASLPSRERFKAALAIFHGDDQAATNALLHLTDSMARVHALDNLGDVHRVDAFYDKMVGFHTGEDIAASADPNMLKQEHPQPIIDANQGTDLEGLPSKVKVPGIGETQFHSFREAQTVAADYMREAGLPYEPPRTYAKVDKERAKKIAEWYDAAIHAPHDPEVAAAYHAMAKETMDQYAAIERTGFKFEFYPEGVDPYPNGPREAVLDAIQNKHLYVYPTEAGFGDGEILDHPLLQDSGVRWGDPNKVVTYNDIFRGVHDYFGHIKEGVGFRADGEENAWRAHSAMYSPEARKAMTSETRGQNSWVNYGPHGEANRTADQAATVYADQKAVVAPDWVVNEGAHDAAAAADPAMVEAAAIGVRMAMEKRGMNFEEAVAANKPTLDGLGVTADEVKANLDAAAPSVDRILSNADVGAGPAETTESAKDILDRLDGTLGPDVLYQGARDEKESWRAFARDIRSVLPEEEWPQWVRNIDRPDVMPVNMTPAEPERTILRALPDETPEELASRQAAADQDYMIRKQEYLDQGATDLTVPEEKFKVNQDVITSDGDRAIITADEGNGWYRIRLLDHYGKDQHAFSFVHSNDLRPMDVFPDDWLGQRNSVYNDPLTGEVMGGHNLMGGWGYKGAISFGPQGAVFHLTAQSDTSTFVHELAHFARRYMIHEDTTGYKALTKWAGAENGWTREAEEKFARAFESWVRDGRGPAPLTQTLRVLSKRMNEVYEHSDLPDVPPGLAKMFERLTTSRKQRGGRLVGADDFQFGVNYIPYVRGLPLAKGAPIRNAAAYMRRAQDTMFGGGARQAIGGGPKDAVLTKAYKGNLLLHGNFKINVTDATADSLMIAARVSAARVARQDLLKAATDIPTYADDVAIKIDPKKNTSPQLQAFFDKLAGLDQAGKLDSRALEGMDLADSHALVESMFPSTVDGASIDELAAHALEHKEPIPNIKWIPRAFVDATNLAAPVAAKGAHLRGLNKTTRALVEGGKLSLDAFNDIAKAILLYLNPAYGPVNLVGNLMMNLMHQGFMMPVNAWKAVFLHRTLNVRERVFLDNLMGHGLVGSISGSGAAPGQLLHATLGRVLNTMVDLVPRRMAFIHEARKMGFEGDRLKLLLDDRNHSEEMIRMRDYVARVANDAIVDYDRMNPMERAIANRVIFFYPWLKGATRYTNRFIVEHPMQAMGLAVMADHAWAAANADLGDRPSFLQETFPLSTDVLGAKIPFTGFDVGADRFIGKHTYRDAEGRPMVLNIRQAFTQTTPIEMAQSVMAFATGDPSGAGDLVQNLTPVPYALGVSLYGRDPFKRKDVPQGLHTFISQLFEKPSVYTNVKKVRMSEAARDEKNAHALFPRSKGNEEIHIGLGGLTPTPLNTVAAAGLAASVSGDQGKQKLVKLTNDAEAVGMRPPSQAVKDDIEWEMKLSQAVPKNATYSQKAEAAAKVYAERHGREYHPREYPNEDVAKRRYYLYRARLTAKLRVYQRHVALRTKQRAAKK